LGDFSRSIRTCQVSLFKNLGNIFIQYTFFVYHSFEHLFLYQNQTAAPLIAARIYRHAATIALHSEAKQHYENNARSVQAYHDNLISIQ
jgi:hypothetical protein